MEGPRWFAGFESVYKVKPSSRGESGNPRPRVCVYLHVAAPVEWRLRAGRAHSVSWNLERRLEQTPLHSSPLGLPEKMASHWGEMIRQFFRILIAYPKVRKREGPPKM